jgi:hypothetical protein
MRYLLSVLIAFFVSGAVRATERPKNFRLDDVVISMEEQRRWPVGYALKVVIHRGKVLVGRTALPCEPCRESEEVIPISDAEVLKLLNQFLASGFFEAAAEYSSTMNYSQEPDGVVRETETVTTDEDRIVLALELGGEWRKQVLDDGEAPVRIRDLQDAIFKIARLRRQYDRASH